MCVYKRAFSLTELLVVVGIIFFLSLISIPAYREYTIRTKVSSAYTILEDFAKKLQVQYQITGSAPNSVLYNGNTYNKNTVTITTFQNINSLSYMYYDDGGFVAVAMLDNNGVGLSGSNPQQIWFAGFPDTNRVMKYACGMWTSTDPDSVPLELQPDTCTCVNMQQMWNNNFTAC